MGTELMADQLGYNQFVIDMNIKDLSQEDSLAAPANGGNCLNWVLGHVVATRNPFLQLLGRDPVWDEETAALYQRGSEPITPENAKPLDEIMEGYAASQKTLLEALGALSEEDLKGKSPQSIFKGDEETLGSAIAAFVFHETYHIGQSGLLRRVAGKEGAIK